MRAIAILMALLIGTPTFAAKHAGSGTKTVKTAKHGKKGNRSPASVGKKKKSKKKKTSKRQHL